jgi:hypothetical protein
LLRSARNIQKGKGRHSLEKKGEMTCKFPESEENYEDLRVFKYPRWQPGFPKPWSLLRVLSKITR